MKYTLHGVTHFDFFEQLEAFVLESQALLSSEEINIKELIDEKIENIKTYIIRHVQPDSEFINNLLVDWYSSSDDYNLEVYGMGRISPIEKEKNRLSRFLRSLESTIKYLSIVDTLINPDNVWSIESANEKNDFILNKLNKLFGDEIYSISILLGLNDISFRIGETREIAENLHKRGYVILHERWSQADDYVKISVKGASYIDRKNKHKKNNKQVSELDKKIDNIIEHLIKLGCGQEVIFNEIDELNPHCSFVGLNC